MPYELIGVKLGEDETSGHPDPPVGQQSLWGCNWGGWRTPRVSDRSTVAMTSQEPPRPYLQLDVLCATSCWWKSPVFFLSFLSASEVILDVPRGGGGSVPALTPVRSRPRVMLSSSFVWPWETAHLEPGPSVLDVLRLAQTLHLLNTSICSDLFSECNVYAGNANKKVHKLRAY